MENQAKNLIIRDAHIWGRNFSGREMLPYNPEGNRSFCVSLDPDLAKSLEEEGWNVRWPKDPESGRLPYLSVSVSYKKYPPRIKKVVGDREIELDEDTIGTLDDDEIENINLVIRPYCWSVGPNSGIKAYVKKMKVKLVEDEFDAEYGN